MASNYIVPWDNVNDTKYWRQIDTHCKGKIAAEVISSLMHQMEYGIWHHARGQSKYIDHMKLMFDETTGAVKLAISVMSRRYSTRNWFYNKTDAQIKEWFAFRIKCCVKEEERRLPEGVKLWNRKNNTVLSYFGGTYAKELKASDVYAVYEVFRGRKASFSTKFKTLSEAQLEQIAEIENRKSSLKNELKKITEAIEQKRKELQELSNVTSHLYHDRAVVLNAKIAKIKQSVMD